MNVHLEIPRFPNKSTPFGMDTCTNGLGVQSRNGPKPPKPDGVALAEWEFVLMEAGLRQSELPSQSQVEPQSRTGVRAAPP